MERSLPIARREAWTLAGVLVVAFILRVAYILGQRGDLLFEHPVVDEELYVTRATSLAGGHGAELYPWFQPPGLTYFLALVFRAFGPGLLAPRLVQALVSTASCGLAYLVARRLLSHRVALATAAICAVHGVLVFESYELLPVTWMLAADLFAVWLLLRVGSERTPKTALFAGVALGVSAVFGPTVLPFAAFAAVWLRRPALVGALAAGVALPIAPVTWANWQNGHELVLISTNGGINFYLGNNDRYDDTLPSGLASTGRPSTTSRFTMAPWGTARDRRGSSGAGWPSGKHIRGRRSRSPCESSISSSTVPKSRATQTSMRCGANHGC